MGEGMRVKEFIVVRMKEFIITTFLSAIFGGIVALPVILVFHGDIYKYLLLSAGVGILISVLARISSVIFFYKIQKHPFIQFLVIFIIIAFGTIAGSLLLGMTEIIYIAAMVILAEIIGMIVAFIAYRYYIFLNLKLHEAKEKLKINSCHK
jgi:uncharacterized membrane protein YccC